MGNVERQELHAVLQELCTDDWKGKAEDRLNISGIQEGQENDGIIHV